MATAPRKRLNGKRALLAMLAVFLFAVVPAIFLPTLVCRQPDPDLPDLGSVPAFSLLNEVGEPFTEAALSGEITIVNFIFTRCTRICPVTSLKMQKLSEKLRDRNDRIRLLSFTVDPSHDTPQILAAYAKRFSADPSRWRFATGEPTAVRTLIEKGFMLSMDQVGIDANGAPDIAHRGHFVLVDRSLTIRGFYDSEDTKTLDLLLRHARFLARTQR